MTDTSPNKPAVRDSIRLQFKTAILDAALDVFSESGYKAAQIREIAERAGVAVGTIYNVFENKEGLYRAIILEHALDLAAAFSELFQQPEDELAVLHRYIEFKGELFARKEKPLRLFFTAAGPARFSARHGLDPEHQRIYNRLLLELAGVFKRAIEKGAVKSEADPFDLAAALDGMTNTFVILGMDYPEQHTYARKTRHLFRMFFGSLAPQDEIERVAAGTESHKPKGKENS